MNEQNDTLLRRALFANAAFSTLCGLTLLLAGGALGPTLGLPGLVLQGVGSALLPFAFGLWWIARRPTVRRGEAWVAVALDLAWVAGSAALVLGDLWPLRTAGVWAVAGVADVVLLFAALQGFGLVRKRPSTAGAH